jgi:ABC-2 type transport system permease protein
VTWLSPYWAQLSANFQLLLRYRMAAAAGAVTQVFWGFLRLAILTAFYGALPVGETPPLSTFELAAYIWLGQALWGLIPLRAEAEVAALVREGGIAYELTRPVDLYGFWLARSVAVRLAPTLLRLPVVLLVATLLPRPAWALGPPISMAAFGLFVLALVLAVLLAAAFTALLGVTCFWTEGGNGVGHLIALVSVMTSGIVLPLPMLPDGVRAILEWLPFAGVSDLPLRIYCGHVPVAAATLPLLRSAAWACVIAALGWCSLRASLRGVVAHGG